MANRVKNRSQVRILVVDDHGVTRRGVKGLLETRARWKVCGEAGTGAEAILQAKKLKPDLVIMDLSMPEINGLEALRQIHQEFPDMGVLILTMHESEELVHQVLNAGARGYVLKSDLDVNLVAGVDAVLKGKTFFSAKVSEIVMDSYVRTAQSGLEAVKEHTAELSPRQREIVKHLAEGKLNKEVAAVLGISTKTVEAHRAHIMAKLKMRSFSELVRYAIREGLVSS
jgi:DNA-binding NarL/FixJ family response regulator